VPGTVSAKPTKSPKKKHTGNLNPNIIAEDSKNNAVEMTVSLDNLAGQNIKARKKGQR